MHTFPMRPPIASEVVPLEQAQKMGQKSYPSLSETSLSASYGGGRTPKLAVSHQPPRRLTSEQNQ